jgi:peptide/nickel transport system substrate-binding protein
MTNPSNKALISRRTILKASTAGATLAMLPIWAGQAQAACSTLRAGITGFNTINTMDPGKATLIPEYYVLWGVFNSLLKFDEQMKIVPDLAESYETLSPTIVKFVLRKGVKFHDGVDMTAEDVKFTLERLQSEAYGSPHKSKFDAISEIRIIDSHTVEIETSKPFAPLLSYLTNTRTGSQIVPRHLLENGTPESFATAPIGTGPFKVTGYEPGASISLAAHEDYFIDGLPVVKTVTMPLIAEESAGVTALLGGSIDVTSTAPQRAGAEISRHQYPLYQHEQCGSAVRRCALPPGSLDGVRPAGHGRCRDLWRRSYGNRRGAEFNCMGQPGGNAGYHDFQSGKGKGRACLVQVWCGN